MLPLIRPEFFCSKLQLKNMQVLSKKKKKKTYKTPKQKTSDIVKAHSCFIATDAQAAV